MANIDKNSDNSLTVILNSQGYTRLKFRIGLSIIILCVLLAVALYWAIFLNVKICNDAACFVESMSDCKRVSWIKEDAQASWRYTIKKSFDKNSCEIEVELFKMKEGTIDSEKPEGKKMICILEKGDSNFPETDVSKCNGELKEELQDIIIQRLHNYILKNIGEINEELI